MKRSVRPQLISPRKKIKSELEEECENSNMKLNVSHELISLPKRVKSELEEDCKNLNVTHGVSPEHIYPPKRVKSEIEVYCENDLSFELNQLYSDAKAYSIFRKLENEIKYLDRDKAKIKIFGKEYRMPRSVAAYGDDNLSYTYSNFKMYAEPWTETLKEVKKDVENATGSEYNFVLINRYENGKDHMGAHKDNEKDLVKDYSIASVSLGQTRDFTFSRKNFPSVKITLENGSLLEMKAPTNRYWYHCLPRSKVENPRINLTFRRMNPHKAGE
ncbi:DNA oxidative demethylase ALKBH2-like [Uloborus diversus]|uniref:DNA oxidative demethylase ALKBH2-like n=1 Tax=Uloborus diversus TaxID=327109 RepID=UPI0024092AED|nr:DNA oxidative demethylase ALKBH2-like [Uloborus diversus]